MRVLLLGPFPPPHGGVQTHLVGIRNYLRSRNVSCAVINLTRFRTARAEDVYHPTSAFALVRLLFRLDYDVAHLHFGGHLSPRLLALALVCSLIPGKKTVLTFHSGGYPSSAAGKTARRATLRGFALRRLDRIVGVNAELVKMFRRFGVPTERVRLIQPHDFVDAPLESTSGSAKDAWPEALSAFVASHQPVLTSIGGLEEEYDIPRQIEMLGQLRHAFPRAGLVVVGGGSLEAEIRRRCETNPAIRASVLICGDVPHAATLGLIKNSDLVLRTTHYDGDSIAVREALHLGTPVLATDNGMRPAGVHLLRSAGVPALTSAVAKLLTAPRNKTANRADDPAGRNMQAILDLYVELTSAAQHGLPSTVATN